MQPLSCTKESSLSESEVEIAKSQVLKLEYDKAAKAPGQFFSIVCLPPKNTGENDRWVLFNPTTNQIADVHIQQPVPGRTAVLTPLSKCLPYCYADQLYGILALSIILSMILSVITTPLILLCCVPMIWGIKKARNNIAIGNVNEARRTLKICQLQCIGACGWSIIAVLLILFIMVIVAFSFI